MFSKPVIRTANASILKDGRALSSPSRAVKSGEEKKSIIKRKNDMIRTEISEANVKDFAPSRSFFARCSDIPFMAATGRPDATMAQHTEYTGDIRAKSPSPSAPMNRLKNIRYKKPVNLVMMFAEVIKRVLYVKDFCFKL